MSADGFYTTCTTCTARLKVRDATAIGQIFACPKCGSMVMVTAPQGMEMAADAVAGDAIPDSSGTASGLTPSDWSATSTATSIGWLGAAVGSLAGIGLLCSLGAFVWLKWTPYDAVPPSDAASMTTEPKADLPLVAATESSPVDVEDSQVPSPNANTAKTVEADLILITSANEEDIFEELEAAVSESGAQRDTQPENNFTATQAFNSAQVDVTDVESKTASSNSASLSNLANLLADDPTASTSEAAELAESAEVPENEITGTTLAMKSSHAGPDPAQGAIESRLATHIRAVRFDKVPLISFLRSMMQLSGVPIQLDPRALEQTANFATVPISVAAIDRPLLDLLRLALEPIHMMPVVENDVVRISSPRLEDAKLLQTTFFVGDLRSGKGRDLDLATLVSTLIEPESWSGVGGAGTIEMKGDKLRIENTRLVTIRTLILLEKLRAARGLEPRRKIPEHLSTLDSRWIQIERYLRRHINMDVWHAEPLPNVVQDLESASGLSVLVDWHSLSKAGVTSLTTVNLHARETPASDVFNQLLISKGLTLVPVDSETVQITTQAAANGRLYVEFYSFGQLGSDGMSEVETLMLNSSAALDPASEFALVVGNAETHRKLSKY